MNKGPHSQSMARRIITYLRQHPDAKTGDVARELGVPPEYVSQVRHVHNMPRLTHHFESNLTPANHMWIKQEAKACGVSVAEMIDAIVTDARMEDEDEDKQGAET